MKRLLLLSTIAAIGFYFAKPKSPIASSVWLSQLTLTQESKLDTPLAKALALGAYDDGGLVAGNFPNAVTSATMPNQVSTGTSPDLINEGVSGHVPNFSKRLALRLPSPRVKWLVER